MTQFVVTVPEYEAIYDRRLLMQLCRLQPQLSDQLHKFAPFTPYRNIWHLANYFACLAPSNRVNCTFLTQEDIVGVRKRVEECIPHKRAIFECRRACTQPHLAGALNANAGECPKQCDPVLSVPDNCASQMMFDLFYRVLPRDLMERPFHINAFLPIYTYSSYRLQGFAVHLSDYLQLENKLKSAVAGDDFTLKGVLMDTKRDLLLDAAISDSKFSLISAICVFLLVVVYSLSVAFSTAVFGLLSLNVLASLAIYRLFNRHFPLLNLITFVLLIAIGSDGAFLLFNAFPKPDRLNAHSYLRAWRHTASTMFLTSFSTVVPFLLNIFSSVIAFRSFGLFAALALMTNYALLISFLPAFLVVQSRYLNRWLARVLPSSLWFLFPAFMESRPTTPTLSRHTARAATNGTVGKSTRVPQPSPPAPLAIPRVGLERSRLEKIQESLQTLLYEVLPIVLVQGRYVWIASLSAVLLLALYLCLTQLRLPRYNPLQLFVGSNLHEYYDSHAEHIFHFVGAKIALPIIMRLVWGIEPVHSASHFDPKELSPLTADRRFHLSTEVEVRRLASKLEHLRSSPSIRHEERFWPERYLDWSTAYRCTDSGPCCNFQSSLYSDSYLDYCLRLSTSQLFTQYNDTPIYHNVTFELVGYTALLPTRLRYSHRFENLSGAMSNFEKEFAETIGSGAVWFTTEWPLMSTWFDLQRSIISDCRQSVLASFAVVFVFAAVMLRSKCICAMTTIISIVITTVGSVVFLGWEVGVLEGVILVLVVGLSFDYTLHYGASVPDEGCPSHRIEAAVKRAAVPVFMAALSSLIGGGVMLFAQTHAFMQVAVFLCVATLWSFTYATFFFLPLLHLFFSAGERLCGSDHDKADCYLCTNRENTRLQLKALRQQSQCQTVADS